MPFSTLNKAKRRKQERNQKHVESSFISILVPFLFFKYYLLTLIWSLVFRKFFLTFVTFDYIATALSWTKPSVQLFLIRYDFNPFVHNLTYSNRCLISDIYIFVKDQFVQFILHNVIQFYSSILAFNYLFKIISNAYI